MKYKQMKKVFLKDICEDIRYGYTASAEDEEVGPKFLRITDIVPDTIDWQSVPHCRIEEKELEKYALHTGDIVIARTGATTGYAKYLKDPPRAVFASYLVRIRIRDGIDRRFISHIVESQSYKDFIKTIWGGAAQPNANAQMLTSFPISLPDITVQNKISSILSAYDDLIENNLRRIKILEEIAQNLYREWFVNFRFPGHDKVKFVDSELGKIPETWELRKLGEIIELAYGKGLKASEREGGVVPVFGSGGIVGYHNLSLVKGPGIIVGRKGNVGSVFWSEDDFFPIDTVFYVRTRISLHYVYYYLRRMTFIDSDAAVPGLNRNQAYLLPFLVPSEGLLDIFHKNIKPIFRAIKVLRSKVELLRMSRDTLLPKLISGELDVSDLDIAIQEQKA